MKRFIIALLLSIQVAGCCTVPREERPEPCTTVTEDGEIYCGPDRPEGFNLAFLGWFALAMVATGLLVNAASGGGDDDGQTIIIVP